MVNFFFYYIKILNIISFQIKKNIHIKKCVGREKGNSRKRAQNRYSNMQIMTTKTTTLRTRALRPRLFEIVICPHILYIVLYARYSLPFKFFPKCNFNKVCFELLQNLTCTDQ